MNQKGFAPLLFIGIVVLTSIGIIGTSLLAKQILVKPSQVQPSPTVASPTPAISSPSTSQSRSQTATSSSDLSYVPYLVEPSIATDSAHVTLNFKIAGIEFPVVCPKDRASEVVKAYEDSQKTQAKELNCASNASSKFKDCTTTCENSKNKSLADCNQYLSASSDEMVNKYEQCQNQTTASYKSCLDSCNQFKPSSCIGRNEDQFTKLLKDVCAQL